MVGVGALASAFLKELDRRNHGIRAGPVQLPNRVAVGGKLVTMQGEGGGG
jgi:hypothetical protein